MSVMNGKNWLRTKTRPPGVASGRAARSGWLLLLGAVVSLSACTGGSPASGGQSEKDAAGGSPDVANPPLRDASEPPADLVMTPLPDAAAMDPPVTEPDGASDAAPSDLPIASLPDARDGANAAPPFDPGITLGCAATPDPPDPTAGWTEFADTYPPPAGAPYPSLEYPYNLAPQDSCTTTLPITSMASPCRFGLKGGVYTFWIFQNDLSHLSPDAGVAPTSPRSEMHWSNFTASDAFPQRMWTGDMVVRGADNGALPSSNCILQVHTNATGQGPVYLRVDGGKLSQLVGPTYFTPKAGTWFNLKVAFNARTLQSTVWINNCQVGTWNGSSFVGGALPGGDIFYFKNGSYGCTTGECIDQFANIRFYRK
jgi:hypothetical protein